MNTANSRAGLQSIHSTSSTRVRRSQSARRKDTTGSSLTESKGLGGISIDDTGLGGEFNKKAKPEPSSTNIMGTSSPKNTSSFKKKKNTNDNKPKKKLSVFERLTNTETFASADMKGKISRSNMAITTQALSPVRQRPVYNASSANPGKNGNSSMRMYKKTNHNTMSINSTITSSASGSATSGALYPNDQSNELKRRSRESRYKASRYNSSLSPPALTPVSPSSSSTASNLTSTPNSKLSPERNAIADLQLRINQSLSDTSISRSRHSTHSEITSIIQNGRSQSFVIDEEHENYDEALEQQQGREEDYYDDEDSIYEPNDELFNLIWRKDYIGADAYLNNSNYTTNEIRHALFYQNNDGFNCLMRAFHKRPPKYISAPDALINQMIEIGGLDLIQQTNAWGDNALFFAIKYKRSLHMIQLLIHVGGGRSLLLQRNFKCKTVLHVACEMNSSIDVVKCLVEFGGKEIVMMEDDHGHIAESKSVEVLDYLQKITGDTKAKERPKHPTVLHDLVQDKKFDDIDMYLDEETVTLYGKRSAMCHKDKNGFTPLMLSVIKQVPDRIIQKMIFIGGVEIVSLTNKWGNIALIYALAQGRSYDLVRLFVEKGGDVACVVQQYWEGLNPLHCACKYNASLDIIQFLVDVGQRYFQEDADNELSMANAKEKLISMKCHQGQNCIHKVCANGPTASLNVLKTILDGCDCHSRGRILLSSDNKKKLPLHIACEQKAPLGVIRYLVSLDETTDKQSLTRKDIEGKIPLHLSCVQGASLEVVKYLANVGGRETVQSIPFQLRSITHRGVLL